jgi:hypothetical protein
MNAMDINIARYLPILREQDRQQKREQIRKRQRDADLKKLAKEVLRRKLV